MKKYIWPLLSLILMGCIGVPESSSEADQFTESDPTVNRTNSSEVLISGVPPSVAREGILYEYIPSSAVPSGTTVQAVNLPAWASLNPSTGVITGRPTGTGIINNIVITAVKDFVYTEIGPFSMDVRGDPLFVHQWHLNNEGQSAFSRSSGNPGIDLNLEQTIAEGITGRGVAIAVSDSGLEIGHPDLANSLFDYHKDYRFSTSANNYIGDPSPRTTLGDHGTSVAGIIAAEGWNNIGGRGVAPGALVSGLNFLESSVTSEKVEVLFDQATGPYTLFNYSYGEGFYVNYRERNTTYQDHLLHGFTEDRDRKGKLYIKSAGNSYRECDDDYGDTYVIGDGICYSHNANTDNGNNMMPMVVVGAMNAKGEKASYSSVGSALWISAFGGEYGYFEPAIVSTDHTGCGRGYSRSSSIYTDFMRGEIAINDDCDYTHMINRTSSSAPMITGIAALMLEANPQLSARDIKHILAATAREVNDPTFTGQPPHENSAFFSLSGHVYEQGWITNAAGFSFHNHFGFGLVDGDAAVTMAKTYNSNWPDLVHLNKDFDSTTFRQTPSLSIPDESAVGATSMIYVSNALTVEAVQIKLNVTHGRPGDLGIELTSPSGTKSILFNINNSFLVAKREPNDTPSWLANFENVVMSSNAFYGESSQGWWRLKAIDGLGGNTGTDFDLATSQTGTLDQWDINISGH